MSAKIKKGDKVFVMSGKDKGKEGEVTKVIKISDSQDKALVQGVNLVKRHRKPSQDSAGGIISEERPVQISNLMIVDPKTKKPSRVGFKLDKDGNKVRFAKKSGEVLNG
jgi:large subunit ribosomal protein L24